MHRWCLRYFHCFVFNNPPSSPCLRVTLLQTLNTSGKLYHSKILKTHIYSVCLPAFCVSYKVVLLLFYLEESFVSKHTSSEK